MVVDILYKLIKLKVGEQERRPSDPNRNFESGEFTKLFQKALETVDLSFTDGIDWKAFLLSLEELQDEYGKENVGVQAMERKSGGAFVVRIEVTFDADEAKKVELESKITQSYKANLPALEAQYRGELQAKDGEITLYKEKGADMTEIARFLASRPIVEAKELTNRNIYEGGDESRETNLSRVLSGEI